MKAATKGDEARWLAPPKGVTTASVCRLSGRLAREGCREVEVVTDEGRIERRSMVYTEYFARGTEPTEGCDLHRSRGLLGAIGSLFTRVDHPPPPSLDAIGLPQVEVPAAPPVVAAVEPQAEPEDEKPRRRGFWSRLFGRGRSSDNREQNEVPEK
jgi:hypothetical protein